MFETELVIKYEGFTVILFGKPVLLLILTKVSFYMKKLSMSLPNGGLKLFTNSLPLGKTSPQRSLYLGYPVSLSLRTFLK